MKLSSNAVCLIGGHSRILHGCWNSICFITHQGHLVYIFSIRWIYRMPTAFACCNVVADAFLTQASFLRDIALPSDFCMFCRRACKHLYNRAFLFRLMAQAGVASAGPMLEAGCNAFRSLCRAASYQQLPRQPRQVFRMLCCTPSKMVRMLLQHAVGPQLVDNLRC